MTQLTKEQVSQLVELQQKFTAADAELIDTAADAIQVIQIIESALSDGFQFMEDIIKLSQIQPIVTEIIRDAGLALQGLKRIDPDVAPEIGRSIAVEARRRGPLGPISTWMINGLYMAGTTYDDIDNVIEQLNTTKERYASFFRGEDVVPL